MTVWDDLVGQHRVVEALRAAAGGHGMNHAWLFTGPPGSGRELAMADVEVVARWATHGLRPHLTVVLDVDPREGLGRFEGRDRIEAESLEFHDRARQSFLDLAAADPEHYLVLDAHGSVDDIAAAVHERLQPLLAKAKRR